MSLFSHTRRKGFTLVEVLVSVALFTVVVTTSVSALLVILDANRKAQNISDTINNAFFTFETMSRLMRTGINYHCGDGPADIQDPQDCVGSGGLPNGADEIYFTDDRGQFVHIWLDVDGASGIGTIRQEVDGNGASNGGISFGDPYALTADDFDVEALLFRVSGSDISGNYDQPMTTILLHGVSNPGTAESSDLKLQTTVTQRMIDL